MKHICVSCSLLLLFLSVIVDLIEITNMKKIYSFIRIRLIIKKSGSYLLTKNWLLLLALPGLFTACSKDNPENLLVGKIHYIVFDAGTSGADTLIFEYDENCRVISTSYKEDVFGNRSTIFTRNSSGQIISHTFLMPSSNNLRSEIKYTIGEDGKYISGEANSRQGNISYRSTEFYIYTGNNITQIDFQDSITHYKTIYSYDNNGNVTGIEEYDKSDTLVGITTLTYDNKLNPVELINDPGSLGSILISSYNNLVSETYTNKTWGEGYQIEHNYTYDESGKPVTDIETLTYTLESRRVNFIYY